MNAQRNTAAIATVPALNEQALKLLAQGHVVRLLAQSPIPVTPGSVLQLQWSPASGMKILRINPPSDIPPSVRSFVGKAMSGQGSPGPLLQTLQALLVGRLASQGGASAAATLPENVQTLGRQIMALLPDNASITRPGVLETFVTRASGLFMEASLASALRTGGPMTSPASDPAAVATSITTGTSTAHTETDDTGVAGKALLRMLGQLRDHLRPGGSDAKVTETAVEVETSTSEGSAKATGETPINSSRPGLSRATGDTPNDFKSLLLQLQQQLNAARSTTSSPSAPVSAQSNASPAAPPAPPQASSPTLAVPSPQVLPPTPDVTGTGSSEGDATLKLNSAPGKSDVGPGPGTPTTTRSIGVGDAGKTPPANAEEAALSDLPASPATSNPRYSRLARAADQYHRLEQMTRPPQPQSTQSPTAAATAAAHQNDAMDLAIQWAEMAPDIDIPGLGLPLPHRQRSRNEQAGDSLDNLLGLLLKRTQESLNRLHLHQLSHAGTTTREAGAQQQNPPLTFDLPVLFDGQVQVFNTRIDEEDLPASEQAQNGKKVKQWSVSLGFDIEGLGPMFCQLQMTTQQANLQFWAERPATLALTQKNIDFLSKSLHELGVAVSEVSCHEGLPKQTRTRLSQQLVDINT